MNASHRQPMRRQKKSRATINPRFCPINIERALRDLRLSRATLRACGAHKAASAVSRAIKSTEGALRHANRVYMQEGHDAPPVNRTAECDASDGVDATSAKAAA